MRILLTFHLCADLQHLLLRQNIGYRPNLEAREFQSLNSYLVRHPTDVLIVRRLPQPDILRSWRAMNARDRSLSVICLEGEGYARDRAPPIDGISFHFVSSPTDTSPEIEAMVVAEEIHHRKLEQDRKTQHRRSRTAGNDRRVTLVGAGIVNLMTAYHLTESGYRVTVYDGSADPTTTIDWRRVGCTFGGNDAWIFSLNESRHHHFKGNCVTASTNTQFDFDIREGGWLADNDAPKGATARRWIEQFKKVPPWLAGRYDRDIISFNQESAVLWREMMLDRSELFEDGGLRDGLLRLYTRREQYSTAVEKETSIGAVIREIDLDEVSVRFPSLHDAMKAGSIQGALEVVGFSLNIHRFALSLIAHLKTRGARFFWNNRVRRVIRDDHRRPCGLELADGTTVTASHYVLSPGAFGNALMDGMGCGGQIASMIGMWLTLPDDDAHPLDRPLKIARKGFAAEGANVIGGRDRDDRPIIHISSGHGFIGADPTRVDHRAIDHLAQAVHDTAQQFFPAQYAEARRRDLLAAPHRSCIRPWTPSGLGIFESVDCRDDGLLIVTGGHNTGGFAQSPSVAQAVVAALEGRSHPMHMLYAPNRFEDFVAGDIDVPAQATL